LHRLSARGLGPRPIRGPDVRVILDDVRWISKIARGSCDSGGKPRRSGIVVDITERRLRKQSGVAAPEMRTAACSMLGELYRRHATRSTSL